MNAAATSRLGNGRALQGVAEAIAHTSDMGVEHGETSSRDMSRGVHSSSSSREAPKWQQITWGKQITGRSATIDSILGLFDAQGHRFSSRNLATAAHRVAKIGGRRRNPAAKDSRMQALSRMRVNGG